MQHKDERLLEGIYEYLEDIYFTTLHCPTLSEIAKKFNISRSGAYNYVSELKRSGRIEYDGCRIVTDKTRKLSENIYAPMFMQSIPCGGLENLDNNVDEYVSLSTTLFSGEGMVVVHAGGDSMVDAGISDGDTVILVKKDKVKEGDIVAALDGDGNSTLKRLKLVNGKYVLHPENKKYDDIYVDHLEIQGVVKYVIHQFE